MTLRLQPRARNLQVRPVDCLLRLLVTTAVLTAALPLSAQHAATAHAATGIHVPHSALIYQRAEIAIGLADLVWNLVGVALLTPYGWRLRAWAFRVSRAAEPEAGSAPPFRALAVFYAAYSLYLILWSLPFTIAGAVIERHFGFARESWFAFARDLATGWALNLITIPLLWAAYRLYVRHPKSWWRWLWALLTPLLLFQFVLQPVVVSPLYNRFTPLPDGRVKRDILALAARAGITGARVLVSDTSRRTTHVNAYVTGVGPTTRIVINDTALTTLPEDELLAMVGHEMGHYVEGHTWILWICSVAGSGLILWILSVLLPGLYRRWGARLGQKSLTDLAALPLIMLTVSTLVLIQDPVANAISRTLEHRADAYGLRLTHLNDATVRLMEGFANRDYTDPDPPWLLQFWFGTHPTLAQRIAFARAVRR